MKRHWQVLGSGLGLLALTAAPLGVVAAGASPPHSDQTITVTKTASGTGAPLAGAVFTLYKWHGSCDLGAPVATATSDSTGHAVFTMTGHHNYCVVETAAPRGYTLPATASQVVKTAHSTSTKGNVDRANLKESASVAFVDKPSTTPPPAPPNPPGGGGGTTTTVPVVPPTAAAGAAIPGASLVHTGEPWAGSTPYVVGTAALGGLLLGAGLLRRRWLSG